MNDMVDCFEVTKNGIRAVSVSKIDYWLSSTPYFREIEKARCRCRKSTSSTSKLIKTVRVRNDDGTNKSTRSRSEQRRSRRKK